MTTETTEITIKNYDYTLWVVMYLIFSALWVTNSFWFQESETYGYELVTNFYQDHNTNSYWDDECANDEWRKKYPSLVNAYCTVPNTNGREAIRDYIDEAMSDGELTNSEVSTFRDMVKNMNKLNTASRLQDMIKARNEDRKA